MYLSNHTLLILTATLSIALFIAFVISMYALRREKNRTLLFTAREEMHTEEIAALTLTCERIRNERTQQLALNHELTVQLATLQTSLEEKNKQLAAVK